MSINAFFGFGDIHDVCVILGGQITPQMHLEAERLGVELHTYSYATWRFYFSPLRQRFYAGIHTWAHRLKGNWIWGYYDTRVHSHVWFKDGDDRPMPTTAWENRREGIDDYRYLQMLEDCIAENLDDPEAVEAASWLEALRSRILDADPHIDYANRVPVNEVTHPLPLEEFDLIRTRAAGYIQRFGPVPESRIQWPRVTHLKDEAKSLRNRSVEDCLAELASPDETRRRAAAWALFEHGPEAASASKALARALDDPEVRIPALHALEAIGPKARSAVPQIARLLSHPDAFIRVGATFTLKSIATPAQKEDSVSVGAVEALRAALWDERDVIATTAGTHMAQTRPGRQPRFARRTRTLKA